MSQSGNDRLKALNAAGNRLGAKTIVGLPPPGRARETAAYLPDTSYLPTLAEFTKRFVTDARTEGADGFYQNVEMPLTDTGTWASVRSLYAAQNAAVDATSPGALVVVSPYLESRTAKGELTPAQVGLGAGMLLDTANGTRLIIAPQDGLGVGTTALRRACVVTGPRALGAAGAAHRARAGLRAAQGRPDGRRRRAAGAGLQLPRR